MTRWDQFRQAIDAIRRTDRKEPEGDPPFAIDVRVSEFTPGPQVVLTRLIELNPMVRRTNGPDKVTQRIVLTESEAHYLMRELVRVFVEVLPERADK